MLAAAVKNDCPVGTHVSKTARRRAPAEERFGLAVFVVLGGTFGWEEVKGRGQECPRHTNLPLHWEALVWF